MMLSFIKPGVVGGGLSFLLTFFSALASTSVYATVSQSPLLLGGGGVPGNLILTPSVEFPTVISVANLGAYDNNSTYTGYFDSFKCYDYVEETFTYPVFGTVQGKDGSGYFTPVSWRNAGGSCSGKWSGNYLNWATTQTIDPFRKALTGGYRSVDTPSKTILEKATRANRNQYFPDRKVNGNTATLVSPFSREITSSLYGGSDGSFKRNKTVRIKTQERGKGGSWTDVERYYSVRVEVCKKGLLEGNCKQYGSNYKPEGLLQQYADNIRYSVFSYLNIDGNGVDGGVLRAPQDYIGQTRMEPGTPGVQDNPRKEWDPDTGVLYKNPHGDATGNSGVINYINKFGELTNQHKSNDPVSELYYAALRYLRNKGSLSDYSSQATNDVRKDYFPVVTDWKDPLQYACQKNAILGIGDVYTHEDRDLLPAGDNSFMNLNEYTNKVFSLEGVSRSANSVFTGRGNSAYIAGLAYYANTQDIRPGDDMAGKQTVSTYWVDVRENQVLEPKENNQYWLAAKYGGFEVPDGYTFGDAIPLEAWNKSGDILSTGNRRPDNFYVASDAENMVRSLERAFAQIANEVQSTTASLAANSSRLETDTAVFQSRLNSRFWSGDLQALLIDEGGAVQSTPVWSAAAKLDALTNVSARNILTIAPPADGAQVSTSGASFTWAGLDAAQQAWLQTDSENNADVAKKRLLYLRGDRSNEISPDHLARPFRQRDSRLGDIVNSDPQFVHQQDYGYGRLTGWAGGVAEKYRAFRSTAGYLARRPMVLVGANDGMLHGFDASVDDPSGGEELFAFVPNAVYPNLLGLTDPAYVHRYFVDGTPRVSDAWLGSRWATVAVGSTGAGGRSIFALDVTDVASKSTMTPERVMWEFSDPRMGYTIGQPAIVALPNEQFGVVVSSGYHDTKPGAGYVWVLNINDGSVIREFELPTTANLGGPLVADLNFDQEADRIYVGDTDGNLWRLDIASETVSEWGIPASLSNAPLFVARNPAGQRQAITAPLSSAYNNKGEHMVLFGTGSFYRVGDNEIPDNPPVDTFYGIVDTGSSLDGRTGLLQQKIIDEAVIGGIKVRAVTNNAPAVASNKGWYLDLVWEASEGGPGPKGERVVARATLRSDRVLFTTMTPTEDPCAFGGTSMIMALDLSSGSRLDRAYFDVNKDGNVDESDNKSGESEGEPDIPWSGISEPEDGVIKGVTTLYKWLCYAGSSGAIPKCIPVEGSMREGRQSWREVRDYDE